MSPNAGLAWLRRRWWVVAALVAFIAVCVWLARGADKAADERRASRARIEGLARDIAATTRAIDAATSPEARQRSADTLAYAIGELRRSIDCAALYVNGERPAACADVAARMDAIRAGGDPFPRPPQPQTGAP